MGKEPEADPKKLGEEQIEKVMNSVVFTFVSATRAAVDRTRWRALVITPNTGRCRGK
jgi:hypothetical protein